MLAGLLLNKSGNFTGWLYGATNELPTLGLLPAVSNALANSTYRNDGAYGAPTYSGVQNNPPSWWPFGAGSWNLVSGIITGVKLIGMIWSTAIAAMVFFGELYVKAILWGLQVLHIPTLLRAAQAAIATPLNNFVEWAERGIVSIMSGVLGPVAKAFQSILAAESASLHSGVAGSIWAYRTQSGVGTVPSNVSGAIQLALLPMELASMALTVALAVVLTVATTFSLGATTILILLLPLIQSAFSTPGPLNGPSQGFLGQTQSRALGLSTLTTGSMLHVDKALFNATEAPLTTSSIQPPGFTSLNWDWYGFDSLAMAGAAAIVALFSAAVAAGKVDAAAGYIGFGLSVFAGILAAVAIVNYATLPSTCNSQNVGQFQYQQGLDLWLAELALWGMALSVLGIVLGEGSASVLFGLLGLMLGAVAMTAAISEIVSIHGACG
jgi:hypothetical protein